MNAVSGRSFISYSHRGDGPEWKAWLLRHLHVFEGHHLLDAWDDERIRASQAWDKEIKEAMSSASAAIHLHRARVFFREQPYPWKSPQADLAAAEKLIHHCGYHRSDQELANAKRAILGSQ